MQMRFTALFAIGMILGASAPLFAQPTGKDPGPDSAAAVFKRMEQPILKCKTFKANVEITAGPGQNTNMKGRLLVAQGKKERLELGGAIKGQSGKIAVVSDGARMRLTSDDARLGEDQETPMQVREVALALITRSGVSPSLVITVEEPGKKPERFDLDKEFAVSDIKLGKKEMVSGKEAQVLDYKCTTKNAKEPLAVTVWIDVKTNLPLQRVVTFKQGKKSYTITERYTNACLDDRIDEKEFELSK